jgi:hypothetical protein
MTGALGRVTRDSIVTTNFHSKTFQEFPDAPSFRGAIGPDMRKTKPGALIVWPMRRDHFSSNSRSAAKMI